MSSFISTPQTDRLKYSVIIATYHRPEMLCKTIRALAHQVEENGEIIVVDQDPLAELPDDIRSISCLHYFVLPNPSMVGARNEGIRRAGGEVVLFLDDDIVPMPNLIDAHVAAYGDSRVGGVAGQVLDEGRQPRDDIDPRAMTFDDGWRHLQFDHNSPLDVITARGCNMSFRRSVLYEVGGFDTHIKMFRDDTDMCFRVVEAGYRIVFEPNASLVHLSAASGGTRPSQIANRGIRRELQMYRYLFRHYRDNLYFLMKHFRGWRLLRWILEAYSSYVGLSRWPWRLVAKNVCFLAAATQALIFVYASQPLNKEANKPAQVS